ncbi:MAG: cyclic pyranopterin monophosphate synthase MoaC [Chloroflexota bacterium]
MPLTHTDNSGAARMVDIGGKDTSERVAVAAGRVVMEPSTLDLVVAGEIPKGDTIAVARTAGIMAAKRVSDLVPLCHPISLSHVKIDFAFSRQTSEGYIDITATVGTVGKTGVEMEALTAVSVAALTLYDMCKAVEKGIRITDIRLVRKSGGKSGTWSESD